MDRLWSVLVQPTNRRGRNSKRQQSRALHRSQLRVENAIPTSSGCPIAVAPKTENGNDLCPYCFRFILQIYQPALRIQTICALPHKAESLSHSKTVNQPPLINITTGQR